ncbi:hypothetical protein Cs7R123_34870 [Catellatospora sp. TT07R-123]|nr:hypothetical protein Cs7R123_34870 [Catellatospora sp. TT07R-123]
MIPSVNKIFLRRSGVLNALTKAESNFFLLRAAPGAGGLIKGRNGISGGGIGRSSAGGRNRATRILRVAGIGL